MNKRRSSAVNVEAVTRACFRQDLVGSALDLTAGSSTATNATQRLLAAFSQALGTRASHTLLSSPMSTCEECKLIA